MGRRPPQGDGDQQTERNTIIVEDEVLRAGFTQIPNLLLRREDISPGAKLTYMVLLSYAWQTDSCFPGHDRLATDMGVAKRSIVTYLQQLRDQGLIRIERRGLGQTNVYRLPKLSDSAPDPRSAKSALQEVQKTTPLEVQNLQPNKDSIKKYPDKNKSNIRLTSRSKKVKKADSHPTNHAPETVHNPPPDAPTELTGDRPESHQAGFRQVGALLPQIAMQTAPIEHSEPSQGVSGSGPRIEVPAQIRQIVEQATQEFHDDPAKLLANLTRTMNLYRRSGLSEYGFCRVLMEAQVVTKRAGTIQKLSSQPGWQGLKNKTPYWHMVVENRLKELHMEDQANPTDGQG